MISPSRCAHKFSAVVVDHFPPGLHDQEMWLDCALSDHSPQTCPVWLDLPGVASLRYSSEGHRGTQASLPRQGNSPQGSPRKLSVVYSSLPFPPPLQAGSCVTRCMTLQACSSFQGLLNLIVFLPLINNCANRYALSRQ